MIHFTPLLLFGNSSATLSLILSYNQIYHNTQRSCFLEAKSCAIRLYALKCERMSVKESSDMSIKLTVNAMYRSISMQTSY